MLFFRFCLIGLVVGMTSAEDSGQEEESEEERDEERGDGGDQDFSIPDKDLDGVQIEVIPGNKKNSKWLVIANTFICVQKDKSVDGSSVYWICRYKRQFNCPFMAHTEVTSIIYIVIIVCIIIIIIITTTIIIIIIIIITSPDE